MSTQEYKHILVGIDGSEQANAAFKKAVEVARRNQGTVYVANVIDQQYYNFMGYTPMNQTLVDQETEEAKKLIQECKDYGKSVNYEKIEGIVAYGSAKEAMSHQLPEKYQIDLIMVGQSGLNAVERFMIGSVSSYIIREALCDVLVVSSTEDTEVAK
ncbi:universal stress protein [Enterococcus phoeniculicola]|jgi:nucleotide-binding universal stress UspA family protein|uniref:Universal stress protein n=1 Tax=Enterococcus phoeniculicola ATCC BAA-412 TaxID=1158610 RepID=R3W188_9ENTE|nr:universal stress protein [Enterococcus phoeniculicola]EOL41241.1 universal stress protein [Enterococcus phoeniculicola ATCC BAA-412]EOT78621.1 universal stress protein [Enterococcus phoeniculicola ATCC BAA-412]OJG70621.1 universal stress protein [Enterococcus phoeniculicola]